MQLCFIGKYPPIEGGVSSNNYWLARGLAERGHQVNLVTNADEVEPAYRMLLEADDWPWYQPEFARTGGRVRVFNTEPFAQRTMDHIPVCNPFVSKLASLGTVVVRNFDCEAIYAYYYEPYAVAAALVAHWTGRPLIVKHAGSDLDRLCRVPDLATAYKEVLRSADFVVTQPPLMGRFLGMGVREEALCVDVPFPVPGRCFHPDVQQLDVDRLAIRSLRHPTLGCGMAAHLFDAQLPTIGVYGKTGVSKGTYDLIAALDKLACDGVPFNFAAMIGSAQAERVIASIRAEALLERTYILPFLPNWKVPSFIAACTAVCFLERDFPVAIHGPIVPREVLACGTCLFLSREIAAKQVNCAEFVPGENVITVEDPRDHRELTDKLRYIVTHPKQAAEIGRKGALIRQGKEDHSQFVTDWERIFVRLAQKARGASRSNGDEQPRDASGSPLCHLAPRLRAAIERRHPALVREFLEGSTGRDPVELGLEFCNFIVRRLQPDGPASETAKLADALRYQEARLHAAFDRVGDDAPAFTVIDRLNGNPITEDSVRDLRPVRGHLIQIVTFDFNVTPLFADGAGLCEVPELELENVREERMHVVFQRTANLVPKELRINEHARELIRRCDGSQTTAELVTAICNDLGVDAQEQRQRVLGALDILYRANVIVFGERKSGWGWTGGVRWTAGVPD